MTNENSELICEPKIDKKTHKNLLVCSYKIGTQPGKHVSHPLKMVFQGTYISDRPRLHKLLDILTLGALALTIGGIIFLSWPKSTPDFIQIKADIAPSEVITGGSSTLTFTYENKSNEIIRDVNLRFGFPAHFDLQKIESDDAQESGTMTFDLGDVAPGQYGTVHVKGTMFGDVYGQQEFTTTLGYTYGEENTPDTKTATHIFSPVQSTLKLALVLPEFVVAYQQVEGEITYTNTGDVTFPDLAIEPDWPDSFNFISSEPALQNDNAFHVKGIEPGETGVIKFTGILGTPDDSIFTFQPSFEFDDVKYAQEALKDTIEILPSPLSISHTSTGIITPGETAMFTINYQNTSAYTLKNVALRLRASDGVLSSAKLQDGFYIAETLEEIAPNKSGSVSIAIPVRTSFSNALGKNITLETKPSAAFEFTPDGENIISNTLGAAITTPVTSPIVLQSFGRYWTTNGDQLGRGGLPPRVGQETKIWIFWNVSGTTNDLSNLKISAELGSGVTLTGRQSVSIGQSVYTQNGSVIWSVGSIEATNAGSVAGAAFEVAITPTVDQVDTVPTLIYAPYISAKDDYTGAAIAGAGASVTTYLGSDAKAIDYGGTVTE